VPKAILEERVTGITKTWENDSTGEENFEAVKIEAVDIRCQAKEEVVED